VILAAEGESRRLAEASGAVLPVPPGDAAALAAAITRLRDDPALGQRLSAAGREFARGYLRSAQIDRLERILERAAQ
jgi:phosphatidyl-myo-inositol alpha-mannosyltransferase